MNNPLDEFLGEYGEKTSDWKGVGQQVGNAMLGAAATAAGVALLGAGGKAIQHIYDAATAKRDFRGMLEWNQDLHYEDQRMVNQSFRTLRQFAPDMSKDPLVAGAIVRQMVQAPQGAAGIVQQALQGQRSVASPIRDAYMSAIGKGMEEGMRDFRPLGAGGRHAEEIKKLREEYGQRMKQQDMALAREQDFHRQREQELQQRMQEGDDAYARQQALQQQQEAQGRNEAFAAGYREGARSQHAAHVGKQLPLPGFTTTGQRILGVRRRP